MAIREQYIDIGAGMGVVQRIVFDNRSHPEAQIQTGYVKYDNDFVAVWRPYDPADSGLHAAWRQNVWRNLYRLIMRYDPNRTHIFYETDLIEVEGVTVDLPRVEQSVTYAFRDHLKALKARS